MNKVWCSSMSFGKSDQIVAHGVKHRLFINVLITSWFTSCPETVEDAKQKTTKQKDNLQSVVNLLYEDALVWQGMFTKVKSLLFSFFSTIFFIAFYFIRVLRCCLSVCLFGLRSLAAVLTLNTVIRLSSRADISLMAFYTISCLQLVENGLTELIINKILVFKD